MKHHCNARNPNHVGTPNITYHLQHSKKLIINEKDTKLEGENQNPMNKESINLWQGRPTLFW